MKAWQADDAGEGLCRCDLGVHKASDHKMMPDKRDECKCHRDCTTLPHCCPASCPPCTWPGCLTPAEQAQLYDEVVADLLYADLRGEGI